MRVLLTAVLALCGSTLAAAQKCRDTSRSSGAQLTRSPARSRATESNRDRSGDQSGEQSGGQSGDQSGSGGSRSSQSSLTLRADLVNTNAAKTGFNASAPGQVDSLTSTNNFINFCEGKTLTNGLQVREGSCNGIVMGDIPSTNNMIAAKFVFPKNFDTVKAFQDFEVKLKIDNLQTGFFTNPNTNYYGAPQQLNDNGVIEGHTHIVINKVQGFQDTEPVPATEFTFFKGIDPPAVNGISSVVVKNGIEAGTYRICSINTAANHQPVLMPIAQHNSNDDCVYFTAKFEGNTRRSTHARHNGGPRRL